MKRLLLYESALKRFQIERINKAIFVFLFLLTIQTSFAQNWVGGTSSDFLDGSNWNSSPTFSSATLGILPVVSPNYNPELLDGSPATSCTVLNIGAGGILTTSANLTTGTSTNTITGKLNVNKGVYTSRVYIAPGGVINVATGATLTGVGVWRLGSVSSANESFININGGTFNSTGTSSAGLTLGYAAKATININNGGIYNFSAGTTTGGLVVGTNSASGTININSGTLNYTSALALNINATNGLINIDAGSMILNGDQTTAIQAFIDANKIKASGAALAAAKPISCKYDIASNTTKVIAGVFVNNSPVAVAESLTVALNGTATVLDGGKTSVLANDTDVENNPLTAVLASSPAHGTITLNTNGTFVYVNDGSNTTTDSFSYKAYDGNSYSNLVNVAITISHVPKPNGLSYNTPNVFTRGVYIAPLNPTVSGGAVISYSVSPSFPAGLSLNTQTGVISGTPRTVSATNNYTITATNLAGSTSTNVTITVNDNPVGGPNTRPMEYLDRGLVALGIKNGVFLSWRMLGTDNPDVGFNLYKNGTKLNSAPITTSTNYVDPVGLASDLYKVEAILPSGNEMSSEITVWPYAPSIEPGKPNLARLEIPIPSAPGPGYFPGDMSVGDLDGDGKYELIFEWEPNGSGAEFAYLEAIDLKGKSLWRISYGQNTVYNGVPFMVYDLDGDGKAEVATVTAPGTKDASGSFLSKGPAATDDDSIVIPRNSGHLMLDPSYVTVFNGLTGIEMATVDYPIAIGPLETHEATWDDGYGKRAASLKAAVLYDKEKGPLLVFCRGIYSRIGMAAYTWDGNNLKKEWLFDSDKLPAPYNTLYRGEGNHGVTVADVDGDGSDELMYGACAIDNNGNGLYATGRGHGDAHALGDLDPSRPGLEYFQPHENSTYGFSFRDAATGEILWEVLSPADVGRGWAADITADNPGVELSVVGDYINNGIDDVSSNFDTKGNPLTYGYSSYLQPVYFDGDIQRELRKDTGVDDVNNAGRILTGWYYGVTSVHSTKEDANLVADILGDWREEMIFPKADNSAFVVFSTWIPTEHKVYTLMHDSAYRMQVATQNVGYNQPANLSYYLPNGSPKPDIRVINNIASVVIAVKRPSTASSITSASTVTYNVLFSTAVTGVDTSDFSLTTTGTVAGTIASVTAVSASSYDVTVNTISGDGTLRLDVKASGTGIVDGSNNALSSGFTTGDVYTIDKTKPTLSTVNIESNNATTTLAKTGNTVTLNFTTSEAISAPTVTIAGHSVTATNTSGNNYSATYTMIVSDTEGIIPFNIQFSDVNGNAGTAVSTTTDAKTVTFDRTVPTLVTVTFASNNANTTLAKVGNIVTLNFTASEAIGTPTVTIAGHSVTATLVSGNNYTAAYTMLSTDTEGTIPFTIDFSDLTGNAGTQITTAASNITFSKTSTSLTTVTIASNNATSTLAKTGDIVTLNFSASTAINTITTAIAGHSVTAINVSGNSYSATFTMTSTDSEGVIPFSIAFKDAAGDAMPTVTASTDGKTVTFDRTNPILSTVTLVSNNATSTLAKTANTVSLNFTASENIPVTSVSIAGHTVTATNTSGNNYSATYTMTASDTEGIVPFSIQFKDVTGNTGSAVSTTTDAKTVTFDRTLPTLSAVTFVSNNANTKIAKEGDVVTLNFTASEAISLPTVTIAGHAVSTTNISGNNYRATYTMLATDAEGVIPFTINNYADLAGNAGAQVSTASSTVTFKHTTPKMKVYVETPTCPGKANGKISIGSDLNNYTYNLTITGNGVNIALTNQTITSTVNWEKSDFTAGTYLVTIAIPSINFQESYSVVVKEISAISAKRDTTDKTVSYTVSGSEAYTITVNGVSNTYITGTIDSANIQIDGSLLQATNTVVIATDRECQGAVQDSFVISTSITVQPNPTSDIVYIQGANKGLIQVYSNSGALLQEANAEKTNSINLKGYASGLYLIKITQGTTTETFKVILK